jgi:phosphotriesterase-related protein
MADFGVTLGYDLFGYGICSSPGVFPPRDYESVDAVAELVRGGLVGQLVLSHDVSLKTNYRKYGGWGYAHIPVRVVPLMLEAGIAQSEIETMLIDNPRRLLEI